MEKIYYKEYYEATKISPLAKVNLFECEDLQYLIVENIMDDIDKLSTYLNKFPAIDKDDFLQNDKIISYSPGLQQLIPTNYLKDLTDYFNNLLYPMIGKMFRIEWYTNIFWPTMQVNGISSYPHIDTFDMAINIFLTDNHLEDGTAFYKNKNIYHSEPIKYNFDEKMRMIWKPFEGNKEYQKYLTIPSKRNNASIYNGKYYHSAFYVPEKDKERKSLVGGLFVL